jgi:hypothetical protein
MAKLPDHENLVEKRKFFSYPGYPQETELLVTKRDEFDKFHKAHITANGDFLYRGLANSRYKLFTTGQRFWITNELDKRMPSYSEFITNVIKLTKEENGSSVSRFFRHLMDKNDDLAILSYIQHYGGPTPLLDFTKNIDVALYFATHSSETTYFSNEEIDNYFSIYVLPLLANTEDQKGIDFWRAPWYALKQNFESLNTELRLKAFTGMRNIETYFGALIGHYRVGLIDEKFAEMFKMHYITNMNILNQEGSFFFLNESTKPLEEIVNANYNTGRTSETSPKFISCYHIHKNLIPYIKSKIALRESFIFPNSYEMIKRVCDNAMLL